jgi:hypothetical protein
MAVWKPLPDDLAEPVVALVVRLRELKDQTGLTMSALARKTPYARASWVRYLNGQALPPRSAVEDLGRLAAADLYQLLALQELAAAAHSPRRPLSRGSARGGTVPGRPGPSGEQPVPAPARPAWRRRPVLLSAGLVLVFVVAAAGVAIWQAAGPTAPRASPPARPAVYACHYATRGGRLYAGHSATSARLVALNAGSQDVVEVQCLLRRHGLDPGRVDGLFGRHTQRAVRRFQQSGGLTVDGIVGPQTWASLRR